MPQPIPKTEPVKIHEELLLGMDRDLQEEDRAALHRSLQVGYEQALRGEGREAEEVFAEMRRPRTQQT